MIVGDADSIIALADKQDANHKKAKQVSEYLLLKNYQIIYPNTAVLEAITALMRAKNLPDKAKLISQQYRIGVFTIEYVNSGIQMLAAELFETRSESKQNTIFDAVIAVAAEKLEADAIFSFDKWYNRLGFKLATDLAQSN